MIEHASYLTCRPSQLLNLGNFLLVLIPVPALLLLNDLIDRHLLVRFIPENMEDPMLWMLVFWGIVTGANLVYHMLRIQSIRYEITAEELQFHSGILSRKHEYIELYRVKDFQVQRPLIYRIFGLGNLLIYTSDKTTPVLKMAAIRNPRTIYKTLRDLVEQNRREKHVFEVD
ncbi:PH domain-containing protein [uncultured Sunxiuqinia sp.]|uniref:PH domain-containing protein n=1 Tax=uncultured Sunxiuqinia sp. TaxID=1573825 RepID=UPI0026335097|nr:PH domain-containing protein [uncultured Sunxiuqinia sp.]